MKDIFRPITDPAQSIYDALVAESKYRRDRPIDEWIAAERDIVWKTAHDYAQQHGLRIPSIAEVEKAEMQATGHCDYVAKFALGVVNYMSNTNRDNNDT